MRRYKSAGPLRNGETAAPAPVRPWVPPRPHTANRPVRAPPACGRPSPKGKQQGLTAGSAPNVMKRKLVPVAQEEDRRLRTSGSCGAKAELLLKIETVHMLEIINPRASKERRKLFLIMGGKGEKRNGVFTALLRRHQFPGGRQSGDRDPAYSARFLRNVEIRQIRKKP